MGIRIENNNHDNPENQYFDQEIGNETSDPGLNLIIDLGDK
jgi:hypothetical protein